MARPERKLVAVLAADVAGYSRLMAADEAGTLFHLKALRAEVIDPKIAQFRGRLVGTAGDSLLIEFPSAVDALQFAVETQERITARNTDLPEDRRMAFRMGVNAGEVILDEATIYGDCVNVAARLEKVSEPGGVVIGRSVYDQVKGKIPYSLVDLGEHTMKNIAGPVRAYRVQTGERDDPEPSASVASAKDLPLPYKPSVAVLPFTNMSVDPEQDYFSDGLAEDLITELSRSQSLFVIARNSSFVFKGQAVNITEVGRKLGVRYVVEGSVRKAAARVRITAQLIEAATGNHVWAERYDRDLEDLFAVQDEVTERIAWALVGKVGAAEIVRTRQTQASLSAYDAFLRGIDAMHRFTEKDTVAAVEFLKLALGWEPDSARAHAWLADAYATLSVFRADGELKSLAMQSALRAIELGDASGLAEAVVAALHGWKGEFEVAETHWQRALALGQTNPNVLVWVGYICLWGGHLTKAREIGERLRRLSPLEHRDVHELLAFAYYLLGEYETSLDSFRRWDNNNYDRGFANLAACLGQLGRVDEAILVWGKCLERKPGFTLGDYKLGSPYRRQEDVEHWLEGLRKAGIAD
ncbi:adenylate/guanylate cyclase domain-containing protein [Mesorhizobium sp. NZP2077]|uniref:adenylate/guanylate cyclase domain-containing protein n=1 Tax=Mesorhizobium sp. NZP2077 TaxID=2483404 RepID=UPI001557EAFF|nr:adenylate/guanylate cyclase domain-containing protein [Mesorhizobium sp. NZP2077]QKD19106.1 adenylate/guanylate cyclase domain-containing protein [Mesorhizobium sp. NZP2077]